MSTTETTWKIGDEAWTRKSAPGASMQLTVTFVTDNGRIVWAADPTTADDTPHAYRASTLSRTQAEALRKEAALCRATVKRREQKIERLKNEAFLLRLRAEGLDSRADALESGDGVA